MAATAAEIIKADQEHLTARWPHPFDHAEPMIYVRGKGATIETLGGERYIDGLAGLWNVNVGHGRAELAEAAAAQMKDMAYFSAYAGSSNLPAVQLAEKLVGLAYDNMQAVFFTCGGAESNESAFKTARFYWKAHGKPDKVKIISRQQAYHGVTLQAMSATGMGAYWKMFEPRVPGFVHVQTCYPYRIQDAMDSVKPEDRWMHAYTYSGHPTCCAVGLKNVEIMERERLWENAAKMGTRLHQGLQQAFGDHPNAGDIRGGKGLLAAVELVEDRATKKNFAGDRKVAPRIQAEMMKRGVVTRTRPAAGAHPAPGDSVYFAPPLVVTEAEIDRLVSVTRDAVKVVLGA